MDTSTEQSKQNMDGMKTVLLKNGSEEFDKLVIVTTVSLRSLMQKQPLVFYELVMLCRDPKHSLFGNADKHLQQLGLIAGTSDSWTVHNSIRNVVLSAVEGEELDMHMVDPRMPLSKLSPKLVSREARGQ